MAPIVNYLTKADIAKRRRTLLADVGLPVDELRRRGGNYLLTPREQAVLRQLDELDYLEHGD